MHYTEIYQKSLGIWRHLFDSLMPRYCLLCGMAAKRPDLCDGCLADLPWLEHACDRCGYVLSDDLSECGECLKLNPPYESTTSVYRYEHPVSHIMMAIKFNRHLPYARVMGLQMLDKLERVYANKPLPKLVIPVPLHMTRLKERGYNQALEIIRPVAKQLNIPISIKDCIRAVETLPQAKFTAKERVGNVKNAFAINRKIVLDHVAIFDDVVTTGSTVSEIAKLLKQSGVKRIDVWCCARTM